MTTYTTTGYTRTYDWSSQSYTGFDSSTLTTIREDQDGDFVYNYNWIDETGMSAPMARIFDPWSHSMTVAPDGGTAFDLTEGTVFAEKLVYAVDWGTGQTTYVLETFEPVSGVSNIFFIGGDAPPEFTTLDELNAFLANPTRQILEGEFEGGEAIALSGFLDTTVSQDDVVMAKDGLELEWNAGQGNDTVTGGLTDDTLMGGAGNDSMASGGGSDTLAGGTGDDTLTGTGMFTHLMGGAGNDSLVGQSSFGDQIDAGSGDDLLQMSDGQDFGGGVWVNHGHAMGGSGNDTLLGGLASDAMQGGNGADSLSGVAGDDQLEGNAGNDTLSGGDGQDYLQGHGDDDSLLGSAGNDVLDGGIGNDNLQGEAGNDTLTGGDGGDLMSGGTEADSMMGGAGNDTVTGEDAADRLFGDEGNDDLNGGNQKDRLEGGDGNDILRGDSGNDVLSGGAGADTLIGGNGIDQLTGGGGADVFRFNSVNESAVSGPDTIKAGFASGQDKIDLSPIDAMTGTSGNQAFTVIGGVPFTAEGQVRLTVVGPDTLVEVNTTGTGGAETAFLVQEMTTLLSTDFIL